MLGMHTGWDEGQRCGYRADRQRERDSERDPQPPETGEEGPGPHCLTPATPEGLPSWQRKDAAGGCG